MNEYRVERAIYLVGGLLLFLEGVARVSTTSLTVYDDLVQGSLPSVRSTFWTNVSVELFVGLLFLLAGLLLFFLAWRATRHSRTASAEATSRIGN